MKNYSVIDHEKGSQTLKTNMFMLTIFLLIMITMFIGVKFYIGRQSKNGSVPIKYGRFQRNLVTLSQTIQFFFAFIIVEALQQILIIVMESYEVPR